MEDNKLRILTYNIHKGFSTGNRRFVLPRLREALIKADADILLLQEVQGEHKQHQITHDDWPECSHAEFIAEGVWPHIAYAKNALYINGHHGNAILSKHPFIRWENINVSALSWASCSAMIMSPSLTDYHNSSQQPAFSKLLYHVALLVVVVSLGL